MKVPSEAGRWLAFPADRLDDAVSALGLHDLRPATMVMGVAGATRATDSLQFQDSQGTRTAYRLFITPGFETSRSDLQIQNWRMLWGNSFIDPYNSAENWYVAREGHRMRSFGSHDYPQFRGEPLPFEVEYKEDADEDEAEAEAEEYARAFPALSRQPTVSPSNSAPYPRPVPTATAGSPPPTPTYPTPASRAPCPSDAHTVQRPAQGHGVVHRLRPPIPGEWCLRWGTGWPHE